MASQRERIVQGFATKYEKIGPFRFRRYDELLGGEIVAEENAARKQMEVQHELLQLASSFGADVGLDLEPAAKVMNEMLIKPGSYPEYAPAFRNYAAQAIVLFNVSQADKFLPKVETATLYFNSRAEMRTPEDDRWERIEDWTEEDTKAMGKELIEAVCLFAKNEREGWPTKRSSSRSEPAGAEGKAPEGPAKSED